MSSGLHGLASGLAADLRRIFGTRLRAIVAYGPRLDGDSDAPLTCLALVSSLTFGDLESCAARAHEWSRRGVATPLVLPEHEFTESLDAFPLEYGEIIRAHEVVFGDNPFASVTIDAADLRRACETQIKSHLVHLRQAFIETGGRPSAIATLVTASASGFAALLRNVARLNGVNTGDRMQVTHEGARLAGLDGGIVGDLLTLESGTAVPIADPTRLFPAYLAAVEQLAQAIDSWRAI